MEDIDFDSWRQELLCTGNIVQDGDGSVSPTERERMFNRYVEIVDAVRGNEGVETFVALVDSLQAKEDYGAYQATYLALRRFKPEVAAKGLIVALPSLIHRQHECAGDILGQLANASSAEARVLVLEFRKELSKADRKTQAAIMDFVVREENGGWLDGRRKGIIKPDGI